ncbi:MAG: hypothetical protein EB084_13445, partial [Proteobacteria bacterium]|nr:hypothetical protein [Pseudomonadota bacterium]
MKRFIRLNARILATLLVQALLLATLPGCGTGGGSTAGSPSLEGAAATAVAVATSQSLSDANAAPIVMGQNGPAKMLQGEVHLTQGVAGATVTVYESDGTIAGTATTDANGTFAVYVPVDDLPSAPAPAAKTASKATAGLATGERRFVAAVPVGAPEGAGTMLMTDTPAPFAHVDPLSTEVSLLRQADPNVSLVAAQQAVAASNGIPADYDLLDAGGDVSPLSDAQLEADAQAYNAQNGQVGSPDLDPFLAHEAGLAQVHVLAARNKTAAPAAHPHRKQALAGATTADPRRVSGLNADNTDPKGTLDPDRQQALDSWGASAFIPTASFTAEQLQQGTYSLFGTIAGITHSAIDGLATLAQIKGVLDAADGNSIDKSTLWLGKIAGTLVIVSTITQLVLGILQATAEDPYLKGLQQLSQQIEQGFKALSQQIQQSTAFLRWSQSQQAFQAAYGTIQGRLSTLQGYATPPSAGLQPFDNFQQNALLSGLNPQGATLESTLINQNLGLNGANAVLDGIAAFTAQSTYLPAAKAASPSHGAAKAADGLGYTLRNNATTLTLRGLEMQYANALSFASQVDAYESRAAYATFGTGFPRIAALSNRLAGASTFGANGLTSLRRRGLQQAPPRFSSDKVRVDASRAIAWSTVVTQQTINSSNSTYEEKVGFGTIASYSTLDGNAFRRDGYRLDASMARNWRLPQIAELRALPGWGTKDCPSLMKSEMGLDTAGNKLVAAYDASAPDPIENRYQLSSRSSAYYRVTKQVRFYDLTTGNEVPYRDVRGASIACIAVLDLKTLATAIEDPNKPGNLAIANTQYAGPLDARVYRSDALSSDLVTVESSTLRAAGVQPLSIRVVDRVIDNPWYSANPVMPQQQARKIHALSAVGIWSQSVAALGKFAVVVDDLSGVVEWQVDDASVARVTNTFSEWPSVSERARAAGQFVSPWFSTLVFTKAGTVKVTANWMQGASSTTASNTVTITETNSTDLAIPPVLSALNVYPTGMVVTNASQLQGKVMSAYGEMSDNTAADYNTKVQWSLLEV